MKFENKLQYIRDQERTVYLLTLLTSSLSAPCSRRRVTIWPVDAVRRGVSPSYNQSRVGIFNIMHIVMSRNILYHNFYDVITVV